MVSFVQIVKDALKSLHAGVLARLSRIIDCHADAAAAVSRHACGDGRALVGENFHQRPMHFAGIGAALSHLVLEAVQFAQDIDRNADVMLGKAVNAGGIVQQDVGI